MASRAVTKTIYLLLASFLIILVTVLFQSYAQRLRSWEDIASYPPGRRMSFDSIQKTKSVNFSSIIEARVVKRLKGFNSVILQDRSGDTSPAVFVGNAYNHKEILEDGKMHVMHVAIVRRLNSNSAFRIGGQTLQEFDGMLLLHVYDFEIGSQ